MYVCVCSHLMFCASGSTEEAALLRFWRFASAYQRDWSRKDPNWWCERFVSLASYYYYY